MAVLNPASKLNLIFDIDHTLIFALDKNYYKDLDKSQTEYVIGKNLFLMTLAGNF
jgi:hypothetical protein